ncbi:MAG: exported protein of unknown function [Candidatus Saccharibacteria bacterium]|nr:exported protein of unknown function [Candidatus Saccharibacteria bacterium]
MRYIIGFFVTIGLLILLIILLVGGGNGKGNGKVPATSKALKDYANTDATVRMTVSGPIIANQEHKETQVTVGRDSTTYESITGYNDQVTDQQTYGNTQQSYASFLRALDKAGYTKGNSDQTLADERGYCALGNRYIFDLIQDGKTIQRFWASDCSGTPKTYLGNLGLTRSLFQRQIPKFLDIVDHDNGVY